MKKDFLGFRAGGLVTYKKTRSNRKNKLKDGLSGGKKFNRKWVLRGLLYTFIGIVLFIGLLFAWYAKDLPTPEKIAALKATESTKIFDRDGNLLYSTGEQRRTIIESSAIPEVVKQATVAVEDKTFYQHHGLNFRGIIRSVFKNITSSSVTGGSTITQQYVKNALLTTNKTFDRKIKEAILSIELEQTRSKDEILTLYLNEIPYGGNIYGVEEAAKAFFGKGASELTLSEAATIAAIPQRPTYYSPWGSHTDELFARKDYVLDQMVTTGSITVEEAETAKAEAPNADNPTFAQRKESIKAPHFVMYVRDKLVELYGETLVNEGGLQVTTTLDSDLQALAEETVTNGASNLSRYGASNAAMVSLDPQTGQVLSMVGSVDYYDMENDGNVNVTLSNRQPGSSFKPIAYATAFKKEYSPGYTIFDLTTDFGGGYTPSNYNGSTRGPVTMRFALGNSLNIPAVKTLALAGIENTIATAEDMGVTTLTDPDRYGLALVLGGGEVKPLELAGVYGTFGNGGKYATTTPFMKITDSQGKVLYEYQDGSNVKEVLDPQIAYEIVDILTDSNNRRPTFGNSLEVSGGYKIAIKTGTTNSFRDAWTAGTTPNLATVVWVGNNDNTEMKSGADGSIVAAPFFRTFMSKALPMLEKRDEFVRPDEIKEATIERYSNKLPTDYSQELVTDIFASWQIPTEKDDVNVVVKVNRINGKLASETTPQELIEERVYRNLHSEMPDNPNWEAPVLSWGASHGFVGTPPTDTDSTYSTGSRPSVSITSPSNGSTVSGSTLHAVASASASYGINKVTFSISGISKSTTVGTPYEVDLDISSLSGGNYILTAIAEDGNGITSSAEISVTIGGHTQSNISTSGITSNKAVINVTTSVNTTAQVYYGTNSSNLNDSATDGVTTNSHSIIINGLSSGTKYYFIIKTTNGSTVTSSVYNFTTL